MSSRPAGQRVACRERKQESGSARGSAEWADDDDVVVVVVAVAAVVVAVVVVVVDVTAAVAGGVLALSSSSLNLTTTGARELPSGKPSDGGAVTRLGGRR
jgi:hypothetical protein